MKKQCTAFVLAMLMALCVLPLGAFSESVEIPMIHLACDTALNGCAGLPITWRAVDLVSGDAPEGRYVYHVYADNNLIYTSEETDSGSFVYTPAAGGSYRLEADYISETGNVRLISDEVYAASKLYMGIYEQDNEEETLDPVEWRILTVEGDRAFVLSEKILKNDSYFDPEWIKYKYCYWAGSYIGTVKENYIGNVNGKKISVTPTTIPLDRKSSAFGTDDDLFYVHARYWCNEVFYPAVFNEEERARILLTHNVNQDSPDGIEGGPDTEDYVFFLSLDELTTYLPTKGDRSAEMTPAAVSEMKAGKPHYYWLRTNGIYRCNAIYVHAKSGGYSTYGSDVGHSDLGYRPAMWISIGG